MTSSHASSLSKNISTFKTRKSQQNLHISPNNYIQMISEKGSVIYTSVITTVRSLERQFGKEKALPTFVVRSHTLLKN